MSNANWWEVGGVVVFLIAVMLLLRIGKRADNQHDELNALDHSNDPAHNEREQAPPVEGDKQSLSVAESAPVDSTTPNGNVPADSVVFDEKELSPERQRELAGLPPIEKPNKPLHNKKKKHRHHK